MPCSGPRALGSPLAIELVGDGEGVGIHFDHGSQTGAVLIDGFDPVEILFCERTSRVAARFDAALEGGDRRFIQFEWRDAGGRRLTRRASCPACTAVGKIDADRPAARPPARKARRSGCPGPVELLCSRGIGGPVAIDFDSVSNERRAPRSGAV